MSAPERHQEIPHLSYLDLCETCRENFRSLETLITISTSNHSITRLQYHDTYHKKTTLMSLKTYQTSDLERKGFCVGDLLSKCRKAGIILHSTFKDRMEEFISLDRLGLGFYLLCEV